ncbi:C-C motif chemokine 21b-like [Mixophyes fleayi]|uniref:C-C motif chemokine 21b-like n=1 Tax=Mixophyes fleayi TaxID=3061075 RepID=UPI003F4E374D
MRRTWTLLLLVVLLCDTVYMQGTGHTAADCCLQTSDKPIPFKVVLGYKIQTVDKGCQIPAVVFYTNSKPRSNLCATPGSSWVKKLIKKLDKLKKDGGNKHKTNKKPKKSP